MVDVKVEKTQSCSDVLVLLVSPPYLDEQQQVDILRLGSLTVLVANVVLLNVNTL